MLALPCKIFLKAYFVISDFSDIVFFNKRVISHWFFPSELPAPDTLESLRTGLEWLLEVKIMPSGTAHSDLLTKARTSVFIVTKSDFLLEPELIYSCTLTRVTLHLRTFARNFSSR